MPHQNVNLKTIRIDGGTQSRVALNQEVVIEYAAVLGEGKELPPVVIFNDGTDKWLGDGFHRYHAYLMQDRASIPADVRVGTQRDALMHACGANAQHGLKRTNDDKRKSVAIMLADAEWSKLSDHEIARRCNVSQPFVSGMRNPKPPAPPAPPPGDNVIGKGGTPTGGTPPAEPKSKPKVEKKPADPPAQPDPNAEAAHGGEDLVTVLEREQTENAQLREQIAAAEADDKVAEVLKWQRVATNAQREKDELQGKLVAREAELDRHVKALRRIGKAVGEDDPSKVAATVELFVRNAQVSA
jgi:hypothetical protein